jgi:hypothetical protein
MQKRSSKKSLLDAYQFTGFKTSKAVKGMFGDKNALVLTLTRRSKKVFAPSVIDGIAGGMIGRQDWFAIFHAVTDACTLKLRPVGCYAR